MVFDERKYKQYLEDGVHDKKDISSYLDCVRPKSFYKYSTFNEFWKFLLIDEKAYMQSPYLFNDPFDCAMRLDEKKYVQHVQKQFTQTTGKKVDTKTVKRILDEMPENIRDIYREGLRVFCLTEIRDSILMWSHYADSHKGFCVEYSVRKLHPKYVENIMKVLYTEDYFDGTNLVINKNPNNMYPLTLYKSPAWSYEAEWRLVATQDMFEDDDYNADFKNTISAVYLGANFDANKDSNDIKLEIMEWAKNRHIKVYQMKCCSNKYGLERKPLHF